MFRSSTGQKVLLSAVAVTTAVGIAGVGTFATFTSSTNAATTIDTGSVTIELGATGASTNRLTVNATGIVPGDTIQRSVDLINSGDTDLSGLTLTTTATTSSLLDTDTTDGLQMIVEACSVPWTEAGSSPSFTYTCSGTTSTVVASQPVIGSDVALANVTATTAGNTDHLRVKLTFPSTAGNTFQALTSVIDYSFTGTQRAATDK